ncbi:hypothetical protein LR48_Vigan03g099500 [Vigna angularis]|uniref:Uncharacterized protein n=1 Tax=Phaseolus angularis TaxID=3914 RepID=A0A0L9U458_PHAAN|nr:hypothetical protein LR48_Vigan03g099500 [Vigna angularis]
MRIGGEEVRIGGANVSFSAMDDGPVKMKVPGCVSNPLLLFLPAFFLALRHCAFSRTKHPMRVISWAKFAMNLDELDVLRQLNQLSRKTSSRAFIGFLGSNALCTRVFGKNFELVFVGM